MLLYTSFSFLFAYWRHSLPFFYQKVKISPTKNQISNAILLKRNWTVQYNNKKNPKNIALSSFKHTEIIVRLKSDSKATKSETTCKWYFNVTQQTIPKWHQINSAHSSSRVGFSLFGSDGICHHMTLMILDTKIKRTQTESSWTAMANQNEFWFVFYMWKKCQPKSTCRFQNLSRDKNQIKCVSTCFGVKPNFSFKFHLHISQCNGLTLAENSKLCYSNSICSSVLFFFTRILGQTKFLVVLHYINHI